MEKLKDYISPSFLTNIDVFQKDLINESSYGPYGNQLDQFILSKINSYLILIVYYNNKMLICNNRQ